MAIWVTMSEGCACTFRLPDNWNEPFSFDWPDWDDSAFLSEGFTMQNTVTVADPAELLGVNDAVATKPKRSRPKTPKFVDTSVKVGGQFVCSYTGLFLPKAIVTKLYGGAYITLPALLAHAKNALSAADYETLKGKLATEFQQPAEILYPAPAVAHLPLQVPAAQWHPNYTMWHAHTEQAGKTVEEWQAFLSAPKAAKKKAAAAKPVTHSFATGVYVLTNKGAVNRLESGTDVAKASKSVTGKLPAATELRTWHSADFIVTGAAASVDDESVPAETKASINLLATQIAGSIVYGNAVVQALRQQTLKVME